MQSIIRETKPGWVQGPCPAQMGGPSRSAPRAPGAGGQGAGAAGGRGPQGAAEGPALQPAASWGFHKYLPNKETTAFAFPVIVAGCPPPVGAGGGGEAPGSAPPLLSFPALASAAQAGYPVPTVGAPGGRRPSGAQHSGTWGPPRLLRQKPGLPVLTLAASCFQWPWDSRSSLCQPSQPCRRGNVGGLWKGNGRVKWSQRMEEQSGVFSGLSHPPTWPSVPASVR